jgi:hypothetical protein
MTRLWIVIASVAMSGCMSLAARFESPQLDQACSADQAAALPEGARVELISETRMSGLMTEHVYRTKSVGTVLKSSRDGVALVNCVVEHRAGVVGRSNLSPVNFPYISRLFRNTGVGANTIPVVWLSLHEMGHVRIVEPPPADYIPLTLEIDTAPHNLIEQIGVDFDFNTNEPSNQFVIQQVDEKTGQVFRRQQITAEWDEVCRLPDGDLTFSRVEIPVSHETPGVQSLD